MLCDANNSALIVVDAQTKLLGAMNDAESTVNTISSLCQAAVLLEIPIVTTEQYPKGLGPTDERISAQLPKQNSTYEKTCFSCCGAEGFSANTAINSKQQVIICGMETHVCVIQTAIELQQQGKQVFIVEDAVCSRKQSHKQNALARMRQLGISITNIESVLFEWLRNASHPQFKSISALIR